MTPCFLPRPSAKDGELSEDGLAADDYNRVIFGNNAGSANEVLELFPSHGSCEKRSRVSRQICQRS